MKHVYLNLYLLSFIMIRLTLLKAKKIINLGQLGIISQSNCKGVLPSLQDKIAILNLHNYYRNQIALKSSITGPPLPFATNMYQMYWNDELSSKAQEWANQCLWQHSSEKFRNIIAFSLGENLFTEGDTKNFPAPNWQNAISNWWNEIRYWPPNASIDSYQFYHPTGHLTQMIWAKTYMVGCGSSYYMKDGFYNTLYVCEYGPAGNTITTPIYISSFVKGCNCPLQTSCSNYYFTGLCCPYGFCSPNNLVYNGLALS